MNFKKNKPFSFVDIFVTLLLITCVVTFGYFYTHPFKFWRFIYPAQAQLAIWSIHCSPNSPAWLSNNLRAIIKTQRTLSNQLAYISPNGQSYTCQSGWVGSTVLSDPVTANTRFRYASMTKLVTHDAILNLIHQHKLKLNDKLIFFFDELSPHTLQDQRIAQITIADLLQHRSGFDRMRSEDVVMATNKPSWCPSDITQLNHIKLDHNPNQQYSYDNRNTCLLGAVIERITRQPYTQYITEQYQLTKKNMRFITHQYESDEVRYDFRNENFWMDSDNKRFNTKALASSAGLSGSAQALAATIYPMLKRPSPNILDIASNNLAQCYLNQFNNCNGYAMWQYQPTPQSATMYFRNGSMPAATSLAIVTANHGVVVWVSNGATPYYSKDFIERFLEKYFYQNLNSK